MSTKSIRPSFADLLYAELLKYKRTLIIRLALLAPLIIILIYFIAGLIKGSAFFPDGSDPWKLYYLRIMTVSFGFFFVLHLVMLGALVAQIDHQNDMWKHLLVQPVSRVSHYWVKWLGLLVITFVSVIIFVFTMFLTGMILAAGYPSIGLGMPAYVGHVMWVAFATWLSSLAVLTIQYVASMRWQNIAVPLSLGIAGFVGTLILAQGWEYAPYIPYIYPNSVVFRLLNDPNVWWLDQITYSLVLMTFLVLLGAKFATKYAIE